MRVALVAPGAAGPLANPGCDQITAGIRYLVRRAVPDVAFIHVEMLRDVPDHWRAAATCDAAILCGNPRFTLSRSCYWECDIWHRLAGLQMAGIRVIDGWGGATHGHAPDVSFEAMARTILELPRTAHYLRVAGGMRARIVRDALMQRIYAMAGIESMLLPCSSWWAAAEHGTTPGTRDYNAVLINGSDAEWLPGVVRAMIEQTSDDLPTRVIASTWGDYEWAQRHRIPVALIPDAESLLRVYARCRRVASMRLHASIPAASVGAEVGSISIDSRTLALDPYGLPAIPFDRVTGECPEPIPFAHARPPDEAAALATLKEILC